MEITGEERIAASRQAVWAAINNPNVLGKCIPRCESVERKSPTEMIATIKLKLGPVSTSFKCNVTLSDLNAPESCTITVDGSNLLAGSAKGRSGVTLREDGDDTILAYTMTTEISGRLALVGSRLIESSLTKFAGQFFEKLGKIVARKAEAAAARA
jgi:carbon monoxide dehydrogenase subunit G